MKNICLSLLNAKSEAAITSIIESNSVFFAPENWQSFPDGSYGTIDSQGLDPHRALVEKITNAIDAVLLKECIKSNVDAESTESPNSIIEAVERFFGIKGGDITGLPKDKIDRLASQIYLIAENIKNKQANIYIIDKGEGQDPKKFKETFLKFGGNKVKTLFVHGRFGTGGFGVLPNAGIKGYELIISKKYSEDNKGEWGWTLIRKNMGDISTRRAWYEYITVNGEIPSFVDNNLAEIIQNCIEYKRLDIKDYKSGTIIKVYDYDLVSTSDIDRDLSRILNRYLFAPALPYRILDAQTTSNVGPGKEQYGNLNRLRKNRQALEGEEKIPIQKVKLGVLGLVDIDIFVGKKGDEGKDSFIETEKVSTPKEAVFFIRNGQSHGELEKSFLKNDVGLSYIAKDMAVYIDCTNSMSANFDLAFPPTRDNMRKNRFNEELKTILEYELKNHEGLKRLNIERKNSIITDEVKKSEDLESFVNDLMEFDPTLKMLLSGMFEVDFKSKRGNSEEKFEGKEYPSYLKIKDLEINQTGCKNIPINSYVNIVLETDAENNYLAREYNPGKINIDFQGEARSIKLDSGRITIKFFPHPDAKIGDQAAISIELTVPFRDSLKVDFKINISDKVVPHESPDVVNPPKPKQGHTMNLPRLRPYSKEGWADARLEEQNLVSFEIEKDTEKSIYVLKEVWVNSDFPFLNVYFNNQRYSGIQIEVMKKQFVNAVYIASLAVHRNFAKENSYPNEKVNEIINNIGYCLPYSLFTMQKKILKELGSA